MTRTRQILTVPVTCWRCGQDMPAAFDLLRIGGRDVAAHKPGELTCVPTLHAPRGPRVTADVVPDLGRWPDTGPQEPA